MADVDDACSIGAEVGLILWWFVDNLDACHNRAGRALATPEHHALDRVRFPLENRFDPAVPPIADPASHAQLMGLARTPVAKEHALNQATDVDVTANDHLSQVGTRPARPVVECWWSPIMFIDVLTVTVLAFFGSRLILAARQSVGTRARSRTAEIARGVRPWHFLRAVPVLLAVAALAVGLLQIPGLSFGWWTAIGGTGNVILGSTTSTNGTILVWLVPVVFLALLIPALALFAEREEVAFRSGAEDWSWGQRVGMGLRFGLIHLIMGIPIAVALALSIGGWYFQWAYLRGYRQGGREAGVLESTRSHLAYNLVVLVLVAVYLVGIMR